MTTPIPQPPGYPLLGNLLEIDPEDAVGSFKRLSDTYGEIFKLSLAGKDRYFLCSERLVAEACDETRFVKGVSAGLEEVRNGVGDGLFTAYHGEHNWDVAHRTLVPAFGPLAIHNMYDEMYDVATQLVSKWARIEPDTPIHVTDDFTRLTLDSIALCAMDKRFNSFYREEMHPFVTAMSDFLVESGRRARRTRIEGLFARRANQKYQADIDLMKSVAKEVIDRRRRNPSDKKDLLNAMLLGRDPKTKEQLTDDSIMNNMITFLIAGHETTSGLLSFTLYHLLKNPEALRKATQEVDNVVGKGPVQLQHISKLPYIEAVLRESLRLNPTAPAFSVTTKPGTKDPLILCGEYQIPADAMLICWLPQSQRDPTVFGDDAEEYRPERMLTDKFANLPGSAWKPFGNGARGCIGRPFAWQEAVLALALVLQNFNIRLADPSYQLKIKQTLTVKPDNFFIKLNLRPGIDPITIERGMHSNPVASTKESKEMSVVVDSATKMKPMTILYGSNSGTCEGLAQSLAASAGGHGYEAIVAPLDEAVERFPTGEPVVLISASYEGLPPDNAAQFVEWIKIADASCFKGAQVGVFGCGHRDWVNTYQKIPTFLETTLSGKGAGCIVPRGETNAAAGTIFDDFDAWTDKLWGALGSEKGAVADGLDMDINYNSRASHLRHSVQEALILKNELLTPEGVQPEKRYVEFRLPSAATYETGDYLALLPMNSISLVSRILRRFKLPWDATLKLKKDSHSTIPTDIEMSASVVLASYVELNTPATKKNIQTIASYAGDTAPTLDLDNASRQSPLDILEANPTIALPFSVYLSMLPPMRIRQYSISSSPLSDPTIASITFSLASDPSSTIPHEGVATHYLRTLQAGNMAQIGIRKSPAAFHPPSSPSTPIIMVCAGTGLAPFRGFLQDRAARLANSPTTQLAPAVLIIGCRDPKTDRIHAAELDRWAAAGVVHLYYAYSRDPASSAGCRYAQDRLWAERERIGKLFEEGAQAYICGSARLGKGVAEVAAKMKIQGEKTKYGRDMSEEEARTWWEKLRGERYAVDVFD